MGLSVAKLLARKGANVAVVARDQGKLNRAVEEIQVGVYSTVEAKRVLMRCRQLRCDRVNRSLWLSART